MVAASEKLKNDARLQEITQRIAAAFDPYRIVLFGSRARGDARVDSDYDIFVEMESDKRPIERMRDVSRLFGLRDWSMDVIVHTPEEVKRLNTLKGNVMYDIVREGVVLYEQSN